MKTGRRIWLWGCLRCGGCASWCRSRGRRRRLVIVDGLGSRYRERRRGFPRGASRGRGCLEVIVGAVFVVKADEASRAIESQADPVDIIAAGAAEWCTGPCAGGRAADGVLADNGLAGFCYFPTLVSSVSAEMLEDGRHELSLPHSSAATCVIAVAIRARAIVKRPVILLRISEPGDR